MEVSRIYATTSLWNEITRLWSLETVFKDEPTAKGKQLTLERLKKFRSNVDDVINELESELEVDDEWLS